MKKNLQSTLKRYAVRLTLYVLIMIGACSCVWGELPAPSDKNGEVAVSVETSSLYTVEFVDEEGEQVKSNHHRMRRHGRMRAIVTTNGYEVTGTNCENAVVRALGDEKYEITINNVAYPTSLSLKLDSLYCDIKAPYTTQYETEFCHDGKTFDASQFWRIRKGARVKMHVKTNGSIITGVEGYADATVTQLDDVTFEVVVDDVRKDNDFKFRFDEYIGISTLPNDAYTVKFFDGTSYVAKNFFRAKKHQTVKLEVTPLKNITLRSVNYEGATIEQADGKYYVTLPDVTERTKLTFDTEIAYVRFAVAQSENYKATVYNEDGEAVTDGTVVKGSTVTVKCVTKSGFAVSSINVPAEVKQTAKNVYSIIFKGVIKDVALEIQCEDCRNSVRYYPNGGVLKSGEKDYFVKYDVTHHLRPNTSIGTDVMLRDGYTLTGWNTLPDGTGEHIGLGSRVTVGDETVALYAEWSKWNDEGDFTCAMSTDGTAEILSFTDGGEATVTVPEYVLGRTGRRYTVTAIAKGAFKGVGAKTVILPNTLQRIANGAFENCEFSDLFFFDNIDVISDGCFENCANFSTVHVNAVLPPRYADYDRHSTYADKIDRLILNKDNKKIVVFGGSGAYYSVNTELLEDKNRNYVGVNVALNGWFNAQLQMEVVMRYMGEGDVFLHVPESCGKYQLMIENSMGTIGGEHEDLRLFKCLELNWDLLSMVDLRHVVGTFDCFCEYNRVRKLLPAQSYDDCTDFMTEWGDYKKDRKEVTPTDGTFMNESEINVTMFNDEGKKKLNAYYETLEGKGCKVVVACACMNVTPLPTEQRNLLFEYEIKLDEYVEGRVINDFSEVLYPVEYFCDSDWHLKYDKSLENTELLYEYLKNCI